MDLPDQVVEPGDQVPLGRGERQAVVDEGQLFGEAEDVEEGDERSDVLRQGHPPPLVGIVVATCAADEDIGDPEQHGIHDGIHGRSKRLPIRRLVDDDIGLREGGAHLTPPMRPAGEDVSSGATFEGKRDARVADPSSRGGSPRASDPAGRTDAV